MQVVVALTQTLPPVLASIEQQYGYPDEQRMPWLEQPGAARPGKRGRGMDGSTALSWTDGATPSSMPGRAAPRANCRAPRRTKCVKREAIALESFSGRGGEGD